MADAEEFSTTVVAKYVGPHRCVLPGKKERKRREIGRNDIIECNDCHQRWKWKEIGWTESLQAWCRV